MFVTVLLRALGWETDETILKLYAKTERVKLDDSLIDRVTAAPVIPSSATERVSLNGSLVDRVISTPIEHPTTGDALVEANTKLTEEQISDLLEAGVSEVEVFPRPDALLEANMELTQEKIDDLREAGVDEVEVLGEEEAEEVRFLRNTLQRDLQSDYKLPLLFQVPSDLQDDLTDGAPISNAWQRQFKDSGNSLSSSATIQVKEEGRYRISNKNSRDNFTVEKVGDTLNVYRGTIQDLAVVEIFRKLQPGDPPTIESAHNRFEKLFLTLLLRK
jgi:DNA-directed RNA polymerase beta subunit